MSRKNIVIICLLLAAFFLYWICAQFAEQILIWTNVPLTGKSLWQAVSSQDYLGLLYVNVPAILIAGLAFFFAYRSEKAMSFLQEAVAELQKVTYPQPKEAGQSAVAVVVIVVLCVVVLGVYDWFWQTAILAVM